MTWENEHSHSAQLGLLAEQVLYQLSYVPLLTCGAERTTVIILERA